MSPTPIVTSSDLIHDAPTQAVYTRTNWADAWAPVADLWCPKVTWSGQPQLPSATLVWRYGRGLQFGATAFADIARQSLLGQYVKIEYTIDGEATPSVWYGIIAAKSETPDGAFVDGTVNPRVPAGTQAFRALGLEWLLFDKSYIDHSMIWRNPNEERLERAFGFNTDNVNAGGANRSTVKGPSGSYLFDESASADTWSSLDIVEYLLRHMTPRDKDANRKLIFKLHSSASTIIPDFDVPVINGVDGSTVGSVLNRIMDRRRLMGYTLDVDETADPDEIELRPYRLNDTAITLGGGTLAANADDVTLDFDAAIDVSFVQLSDDTAHKFERVTVRGARAIGCFSLSDPAGTLATHWTAGQETQYEDAATADAEYPSDADDRDRREQMNRIARSADAVRPVYSWFGLPDSWDGMVDDITGDTTDPVPWFPTDAVPANPEPLYSRDVVFLPRIPLKSGHDYLDNQIPTATIVDNSGGVWEFLRPLVLFQEATFFGNDPRWVHGEKLNTTAEALLRKFTVRCRPHDKRPIMVLDVVGAPQHAIASADYSGPGDDSESPIDDMLDFRDGMVLTVALEADRYCQASFPDPITATDDTIRELVVDIGDEAQLHYVAKHTVTGINNAGKLEPVTDGGFIRDDRAALADIAETLYDWYDTDRQAFQFAYRQISGLFRVGDLIVEIGSGPTLQSVRSVITQVSFEMPEGRGAEPPACTTTISTGFGTLDVNRLAVPLGVGR